MHRDRAAVIEHVRRLHEQRRAEGAPLVTTLRSLLPEVTTMLRERFGVQRVLLVGSFARGTPRPSSDVDLAVEGLSTTDVFRAMADSTRILGRDVDLLRLEDLKPEDRLHLLAEAIPA